MSLLLLLSIALPSAVPESPNGTLLALGTTCSRDADRIDRVRRDVALESHGGREVLRIVERRRGPGVDRRDELLAMRENLLPITFRRHDHGRPTIDLDYVGPWIVGWREIDGGRTAVATRPNRVVWDGNMLAPLRDALPRRAGRLPVFRDNRIVDETVTAGADTSDPEPTAATSLHRRDMHSRPRDREARACEASFDR